MYLFDLKIAKNKLQKIKPIQTLQFDNTRVSDPDDATNKGRTSPSYAKAPLKDSCVFLPVHLPRKNRRCIITTQQNARQCFYKPLIGSPTRKPEGAKEWRLVYKVPDKKFTRGVFFGTKGCNRIWHARFFTSPRSITLRGEWRGLFNIIISALERDLHRGEETKWPWKG